MKDTRFDPTVFTKNRERSMEHEAGQLFFDVVVRQARASGWMSDDHFTVDGARIEVWTSMKSFRPKGGRSFGPVHGWGPGGSHGGFSGEKRTNQTPQAPTDPESRLMRKATGKEARLCFGGACLVEEPQRAAGGPEGHPGHGEGRSGSRRGDAEASG